MEVFMNNLPADLTDQSLRKHLTPHLKALGILDYICQKQRKKKNGNISFLNTVDGERFLQRHGALDIPGTLDKKGNVRSKAQLRILNMPVYCKRNFHPLDPFLMKSLVKAAEDRVNQIVKPPPQQQQQQHDSNVVFKTQKLMCGYYAYTNGQLAYSPEVSWPTTNGLAKFLRNDLIIEMGLGSAGETLRVEIPYRIIDSLVTSTDTLTLTLWEPPRFFSSPDPNMYALGDKMAALSTHRQGPIPNANVPMRTRLTEIPVIGGNNRHRQYAHRDIMGQALVYRLEVDPVDFRVKVERLRARDVLSIVHHNFRRTRELPYLYDEMKNVKSLFQKYANVLPFDILFQLQTLMVNNYLLPWTVERLLQRILKLHKQNPSAGIPHRTDTASQDLPISAAAIRKLHLGQPFPGPDQDASLFEFDEIWRYLQGKEKEIRLGLDDELISERARQNLTYVYKAQVTPTNLTFNGPELEAKNRILRRFPNHIQYFLRVTFCEEDGQDIFFNGKICNEDIYRRFRNVFNQGIQLAGRVYSFLGFSHSSLRSHSAWFMAPFFLDGTMHTHFSVIQALGKFAGIQSPARCAARIGQAFSETPFAVSLKANNIEEIPICDVKSKDGSRVFSDGVGFITRGVLNDIHAAMPDRKTCPTCVQVRYGGVKGMLALADGLPGNKMYIRPSMDKFRSDDKDNLEICDMASKPILLYLNRQLIKILEDMEVPDDFFFHHQSRELERLKKITAHTYNTVAFLKRQKVADRLGFPQFIRRLHLAGIDFKLDRFLCSVVEATILRELRLLKYKSRIPIDEGVTLFGIMDESGVLKEGEIYVTFDRSGFVHKNYLDLNGCEMLITRSPALHPGDIQSVINRVPPEGHPLRSLRNCIVFSNSGTRDLPSQLGGGDLDGDIFSVIWDRIAVSGYKHTFDPADYPRVEPFDIGREVTKADMSDFFVKFMATDQLGHISMKHTILADQKPDGTADEGCKLLAHMASTAVDYSKTGIPADMSQMRHLKINSRYRPDFLAPAPPTSILKNRNEIFFDAPIAPSEDEDEEDPRPSFLYYRSDKILGRLYRAIDEKQIWNENVHTDRIDRDWIKVWDGLLRHVSGEANKKLGPINWRQHIDEAWDIRDHYEDGISGLTSDYSDHAAKQITELEVFTGAIFNKTGSQTRRQRDRSIQLKDEFQRIATATASMIRKCKMADLTEEADLDEDDEDGGASIITSTTDQHMYSIVNPPTSALELSYACLQIGCQKEKRNQDAGWGRRAEVEFHSFKIVAACCMIKELDLAIKRAIDDTAAAPIVPLTGLYVSGR